MAIIRNFRLPVGVGISADYIETFGVIQSTSPANGAIVSRGGVGVGNSISVGGWIHLYNGNYYTALRLSATGNTVNTVYTLPPTSPATGTSVLQSTSAGVMSWVPMVPNYSVSAGTATTATYAHQSGYAITSGSSGTATTATYSHQSGYGITAGFATTSSYSHQSGYGITAGLATTATYSHQAGYAITSGSSGTSTTATYSHQSGYATTSGFATTSSYSYQSGYGITAGFATTSSYSYQSGYGLTSGIATTATNINVVLASTSASHQLLFTPTSVSASGVAVSSNSTLVYNPSTDILSVSGLAITATTNSTSFTTGALIVSGGVGVGGSSHFNSSIHITSTINSTDYTTGALIVDGGIGISKDTHIGGFLHILNTTNASSGSTAALVVDGGIGVSKDIYLGGTVLSGSWAGNAITGRYGGTGYSTYTKGDILVGAGSTFIKVGIGASHQVLGYSSTSSSGLGWTDLSLFSAISTNYGCFYSTSTQPVIGANTITPITVNSTYEASNIEIYGGAGTSSRIRILNGGVYNIQLSAQMNLTTGNQPKVADFWFRINGNDVPWSNSKQTILGQDNQHIFSLNFVSTFTAGQYFELMMNSDNDKFILEANTAGTGPTRPATPSIIFTVTKVL